MGQSPASKDGDPPRAENNGDLLDHAPPQIVFERHFELRRLASVLILGLFTAVLLIVSFPPFDLWWVGYVALVPWTLAVVGGRRGRLTVLIAWATALVYWACALYWLMLPTVVGALATMIYLSLYWLLAAVVLRRALRRGWPAWGVMPVVWVGIEFLQSRIISGFPWFFLAQSQWTRTRLIQVADITGQYGVSFLVAMVNGLLVDMLTAPLLVRSRGRVTMTRRIPAGLLACVLAVAAMLGYGTWRLSQPSQRPGPLLGIVQEAVPISLQGRTRTQGEVLEDHLQRMSTFIGAGCDALLLPETMLPTGLNRAAVHVEVDALHDASAASLAEKLLGCGVADALPPGKLRRRLREYIGPLSPEAYRRPAMIVALGEFVEPAELDQLHDDVIRRVGRILFGDASAAVDLSTLRAAVGAFVMGYEPDLPAETDAAAAALLDVDDLATWRERHRYGLQRSSADRIACLRGHAGLVRAMAILVDAPIIAGASSVGPNPHPTGEQDIWVYRNAAVRFDAGGIAEREYAKMHLVPFSEYVPFKYRWPAFHNLLRRFVPPSMPQLEPGRSPTHFKLDTPTGVFDLATPICYEGTFATICRWLVRSEPKDTLVLANLSNDGWFTHRGAYWDWLLAGFRNDPEAGPWQGTTEQSQHLSHYAYRAVELRVPVVRAVNTGISAHITSNGRLQSVVQRMAGDDRQTTMIAGTLATRPLVDSRLTVYSLIGDLFAITVTVAAGFLVAWMIWRNRRDASTE